MIYLFTGRHTTRRASDLFEALNWKQLNRKTLVDRTRSVLTEKVLEMVKARAENEVEVGKAAQEKERLAEKELEMVKTQADARVLWAEARAIKAELETPVIRLKAKNLEILRLGHSVNLRHAIGKCIEGMARGRAHSPLVESFQEEEVLPRLGLKPTSRVTI
jgi:hypothetical protein